MDLWIRSQNGECLMKACKFDLDNDKTGIFCYSYDDMALMGKYKSKERALEVLNNIQHWLIQVNDNKQQVIVYEMPKE